MTDETAKMVKLLGALSGMAVTVVECTVCRVDRALEPEAVASTGLPGRCHACGASDITLTRWRSRGGQLVKLD